MNTSEEPAEMVWEGKEKTRRSSEEEDVSIWPLGSPPHILITTPSSSQRHTPFLPDFPCVGPLTSVVSFSLHCPCLRNDVPISVSLSRSPPHWIMSCPSFRWWNSLDCLKPSMNLSSFLWCTWSPLNLCIPYASRGVCCFSLVPLPHGFFPSCLLFTSSPAPPLVLLASLDFPLSVWQSSDPSVVFLASHNPFGKSQGRNKRSKAPLALLTSFLLEHRALACCSSNLLCRRHLPCHLSISGQIFGLMST